MNKSELEEKFYEQIRNLNAPQLFREYRFQKTRRWRADFAYPSMMLLIEIEGGTWVQGSHTRGKRYASDCEKYNIATIRGWKILRFTADMIKSGQALKHLKYALHRMAGYKND